MINARRYTGGTLLALWLAILTIWAVSFMGWTKRAIEHGPVKGASAGFQFAGGQQRWQTYTRLTELVQDSTHVAANTCQTIYSIPFTPSYGYQEDYAGLALVHYDGADAGINCDGGVCVGQYLRRLHGEYRGGAFCTGAGLCAYPGHDGGGIDTDEGDDVNAGGYLAGVTANLVWTSTTIGMRVCAGAYGIVAAAGISGQEETPYAYVAVDAGVVDSGSGGDAGTDAGGDSGPVDSGPVDSGPPPIITSVIPNYGSAAGGWALQLRGSNLSTATGVTINGVACTGVSYDAVNNVLNATAPAYGGGPNGTSAGKTIVVTTPAGAASSVGSQQNYYYLPSNNTFAFAHRADAEVTIPLFSTTVSSLGDLSVSSGGDPWTQATGGLQPTVGTNFNGVGLNYITFNGTTQYLSTTLASSIPSGEVSVFMVGQFNSFSGGNQYALSLGDNGGSGNWQYSPLLITSGTNFTASDHLTNTNFGAADTNAHVFSFITGAAGATQLYLDSTVTLATSSLASLSGVTVLGGIYLSGSVLLNVNYNHFADICYNGPLSAGDIITVQAILKAVAGTP